MLKTLKNVWTSKEFNIGDYVLITYPNRPPHKLAPKLRGPLIIVDKSHPDIFVCRDLVTEKDISVHIERLREFKHEAMPEDEAIQLLQLY